METKHTPVPWVAESLDPAFENYTIRGGDDQRTVAEMGIDMSREEERANARLIASAPDMLAEMQRHLWILERAASLPDVWELLTVGTGVATLNGYKAAIAKALGQ